MRPSSELFRRLEGGDDLSDSQVGDRGSAGAAGWESFLPELKLSTRKLLANSRTLKTMRQQQSSAV
jgi:hypothetical protein